jgi:AMMECR1 domain-containing protein
MLGRALRAACTMAAIPTSRRVRGFPWRLLGRRLVPRERVALSRYLAALLAWQRTMARWPPWPSVAPDATPFVSIYVDGRVRGCIGVDDGAPGERIARAFVRALGDARFPAIRDDERGRMIATVAYTLGPVRTHRDPDEALGAIEVGTHGVLLVHPDVAGAILLPQVARDGGLDAAGLLGALARKATLAQDGWRDGDVLTFCAQAVGSQPPPDTRTAARSAEALGAAWLMQQIARDGSVCFAVDPRTGHRTERGPMYHGRAATLVEALASHPAAARHVARARAFLAREITAALAGRPVAAWPDQPAMVGGTLALAALAGVAGARRDALAFARESPAATASAWHAAQLVAALGRDAPEGVWQSCVAESERNAASPWIAQAAVARGDAPDVLARCDQALSATLRERGPHRGGAALTSVPEIALTGACVEALAKLPSRRAQSAAARGREFIRQWQFIGENIPAVVDPAIALGAFPASPVRDVLRCDITAHALLALSTRGP